MTWPRFRSFLLDKARTFRWEIVLGLVLVTAGAANAIVIYDDLFFIEGFPHHREHESLAYSIKYFFFLEDLRGHEYRLYGLSKVLHFALWHIAEKAAWIYGGLIALAQFVSGLGVRRLLLKLGVDAFQAWAVVLVWMISPFCVTTCFHHYSYLLLPYHLTILTAVLFQNVLLADTWRWSAVPPFAILAFAVALTGESHFAAWLLILTMVCFLTPTKHKLSWRLSVIVMMGTIIVTAVLLHRLWWVTHAPIVSDARYTFALPDIATAVRLSRDYLSSLLPGLTVQVVDILYIAKFLSLGTLWVMVAVGLYFWRKIPATREGTTNGLGLPAALVLITFASILIFWVVGVVGSQISAVNPRRYGYVPNTLFCMTLISLLAAPLVRRKLGRAPSFGGVLLVGWLWLTLVVVSLPIVRKHDGRLWSEIARALKDKPNATLLFASATNTIGSPNFTPTGLRGAGYPEIFESTMSHSLWQGLYARNFLGVDFVGFRYTPVNSTDIRVDDFRSSERTTIVPRSSIIVVADTDMHPPARRSARIRAAIFTEWADFKASLAAHGASISRSGKEMRPSPYPEEAAIDLGALDRAGAMLPDKNYGDEPRGFGPIVNYGIEEGEGGVYTLPDAAQYSWWATNRHGAYTYRIDFKDRAQRMVALDWLDYWHSSGGKRPMIIEAAADDQWYSVGVFDPAAEAGQTPVTLELLTGTAQTFRVRIKPAPGATDIPFIAGIRILGLAP